MAYLGALGVVMTRKDAQQFVVFIITILAHVPQQTHRTNRCQESLGEWRLPRPHLGALSVSDLDNSLV